MSDAQLPLPPARPHNNHQLFSDHYLNAILPNRPAWRLLMAESQAALAAVDAIYHAYTPSANEAQTEHDLIRPVLRALGFDFEVQPALKTPDGAKRPDYAFYRDPAALHANKGRMLDDTLPQQGGFAVGDAKYWDRPLDITLRGKSADPFNNKNPSFQIAFYIQHTGVAWGLLTNGRLWRLYHRETAHKLDRYYEVDLPALLEGGDPNAFLYFYTFFRRAAFEEGPLSAAEILRESVDYARGIGDSLQRQVFDALLHLAQGFLDYPANGLHPDPATLKEIYDNSLIVLYRLLFVLYAEDRNLLPVHERGLYRDTYSLYAIKRAVANDLSLGRRLLPTSARVWPQLRDLFQIIDVGNPPLHVATFNGGLFDPRRHPFLEHYIVGDQQLQRAIDCLAQVNGQFVDYRDLSVRHLGTIYEGLLEYHLALDTPSPDPVNAPHLPNADARIPPPVNDEHLPNAQRLTPNAPVLTLLNDKGERKATGSYYTPDSIVKYMVEGALAPILEAATADLKDDAAKITAVLGVKVLDPAMGSGHFPVEATEYIARFLVDLGVLPEGDAGAEADLAYWKRRVAQNCIYGVDLNPLAVELAKLSLWLTTVAKDRPLSFLDHHLRTGNALVGARLDDLRLGAEGARVEGKKRRVSREAKQEAAGQISMLTDDAFRQSMSHAVSNMWLIEGSEARTVGQVKEQEALYADLRASFTGKYGRLADLVTATAFGLTIDPGLRQPLYDFATGRTLTTLPALEAQLATAQQLAERYRFFHWELEFPEVFFDRFGRPLEGRIGAPRSGFDVVIGNPPYVRQEQLTPFKPYLQSRYAAFHGVADLYLYFFEQGLKLTRAEGRMAYISSGTFARANFATEFRKMLPTLAQLETLIDFGENQPFDGAEMVRPSIVLLRRGAHTAPFRSLLIVEKVPESLERALEEQGIECDAAALDQPEWTFQAADSTRLFTKLLRAGRKLGDVVEGRMYRGVLTGLNEAFIIDTATRARLIAADPASEAIIKPVLRGEDLRPWYQEDEGRWLIFTRRGIDIDAYPAIKEYLAGFRAQLEPRPNDWDESKPWPGRKPGSYQWYEIQDSVDYYEAFDQPKIFWPDIAKLPRFSWDCKGKYINNKGYIIPDPDPALLGILQSRVSWFVVSQICQPLRLRAGLWQYQMFTQFITRLPIPDLSDAERETIEGLAMGITKYAGERYALHGRARHRLLSDLGTPGKTLNNRLTAWWDQNFSVLRAELKKVFGRDIPLKERDDWESWFTARKAEHDRLTAEIVRLETELNARVYALFDLTPDEIRTIEEQTRYRYGEV
jgi:hypothetical protein